MALPMTRPWKHPKTGVYWLRKRVPEDLRQLLGKTEEKRSLGTKDPRDAKTKLAEVLRWVPWLGAYTGARVSELCQLRREDVAKIDGIWCLKVTFDAGSLKNASSERVVPIHPALLSEGFLSYVKSVSSGAAI